MALIDRAVARRGPRGVGGRRRGLRRRPAAAGRHPRSRSGLRAGRRRPTGACPPTPARSASIALPGAAAQHGPGRNTPPVPAATARGCYSWAWIALLPEDDTDTGEHHLLIRRNDATGELAYLRCYSTAPGHRCTPWSPSPDSAGASRNPSKPPKASPGSISTRSGAGPPGTAGPPWPCSPMPSWPWPPPPNATPNPTPTGLITLTVNEFRRLFDALLLATHHTITTLLAWSRWRRRHQYRARQSHYRRREHQ